MDLLLPEVTPEKLMTTKNLFAKENLEYSIVEGGCCRPLYTSSTGSPPVVCLTVFISGVSLPIFESYQEGSDSKSQLS